MTFCGSKAVRQKGDLRSWKAREGGAGKGGRYPKDSFWVGLIGEEPDF